MFSEPVKNRLTGFKIRYPFVFTSINEFSIPKGFSVKEWPEDFSSSKTEFGSFEIKYSQSTNSLKFKLKVEAKDGNFNKNQYQAYYRFNQEILEKASPNLSFTKLSASPK